MHVDLQDKIKVLQVYLQKQFNTVAQKTGLSFTVADNFLGIQQINLAEDEMDVLVGYSGTADINVHQPIQLANF